MNPAESSVSEEQHTRLPYRSGRAVGSPNVERKHPEDGGGWSSVTPPWRSEPGVHLLSAFCGIVLKNGQDETPYSWLLGRHFWLTCLISFSPH